MSKKRSAVAATGNNTLVRASRGLISYAREKSVGEMGHKTTIANTIDGKVCKTEKKK